MRIYPLLSKVVDNQNTDFKITIVYQKLLINVAIICPIIGLTYRRRALKSRSKLRAAIGLRAAFGKILLHQNSSLCTVTFGEKVLTLAKSRG